MRDSRAGDRIQEHANRVIFEEAVWFCWQAARPAFMPSPERIAAMKRHIAGRFLNVALLDAAWMAVQQAEKDAFRSGLLRGSSENVRKVNTNLSRSISMNCPTMRSLASKPQHCVNARLPLNEGDDGRESNGTLRTMKETAARLGRGMVGLKRAASVMESTRSHRRI